MARLEEKKQELLKRQEDNSPTHSDPVVQSEKNKYFVKPETDPKESTSSSSSKLHMPIPKPLESRSGYESPT
jgi:hypothetical protein